MCHVQDSIEHLRTADSKVTVNWNYAQDTTWAWSSFRISCTTHTSAIWIFNASSILLLVLYHPLLEIENSKSLFRLKLCGHLGAMHSSCTITFQFFGANVHIRLWLGSKDGAYTLPVKTCSKKYIILRSQFYHCQHYHRISISTAPFLCKKLV